MKGRLGERGFTPLELIVVVAILSVLMASAMMAYGGFRERAKKV